MERWDKPYRIRLFSPIEGRIVSSDRMMEENISLTAYEMELYEEPIRDSLKRQNFLEKTIGSCGNISVVKYRCPISDRCLWK